MSRARQLIEAVAAGQDPSTMGEAPAGKLYVLGQVKKALDILKNVGNEFMRTTGPTADKAADITYRAYAATDKAVTELEKLDW